MTAQALLENGEGDGRQRLGDFFSSSILYDETIPPECSLARDERY